ncbi:energy transducer TonB [uncultured Megasphaera sp.]|uniref:energy transducer TonB n=1 Tax=uncultured Megasphaera sp. TaxID=165188 RepID=UPI002633314D|nr:energy transducer TonB [uncultured Megasphaera sp.]
MSSNTAKPAPAFPPSLQGKGISGSVTLSIVVGADGSVQSALVAGSSGYPEMDAAAQQAIYNYSFEPARNNNGDPVPCRTTKTINFHGHKKKALAHEDSAFFSLMWMFLNLKQSPQTSYIKPQTLKRKRPCMTE